MLISCMCAHLLWIYRILLGYCLILAYKVTPTYFLPERKMKQGDNLPKAVSSVLLEANLQHHTTGPQLAPSKTYM